MSSIITAQRLRYRDYVIRAFNADVPYDLFVPSISLVIC